MSANRAVFQFLLSKDLCIFSDTIVLIPLAKLKGMFASVCLGIMN